MHPTTSPADARNIIIPLGANSFLLIAKGIHTMKIPIIIAVFAVTEPIALPAAISTLPLAVAWILTIISGKVVATETIVAPITNFGTPRISAIQLALSTNQSPPLIIRTRPTTNKTYIKTVCIFLTTLLNLCILIILHYYNIICQYKIHIVLIIFLC